MSALAQTKTLRMSLATVIAGMDSVNGIIGMKRETLLFEMRTRHTNFTREELTAIKMFSTRTNMDTVIVGTTSEARLCADIWNSVKRMMFSLASREPDKPQN